MKDQVARDEIRGEKHSRMADSFLIGRRVSKLEESKFTYRNCPKCKRNTLQIFYDVHYGQGGVCFLNGFYRCTLCDSALECHQETKCVIIEEKK